MLYYTRIEDESIFITVFVFNIWEYLIFIQLNKCLHKSLPQGSKPYKCKDLIYHRATVTQMERTLLFVFLNIPFPICMIRSLHFNMSAHLLSIGTSIFHCYLYYIKTSVPCQYLEWIFSWFRGNTLFLRFLWYKFWYYFNRICRQRNIGVFSRRGTKTSTYVWISVWRYDISRI